METRSTVISVCNFPIIGEVKATVIHDPISIPAADPKSGIGIFIVKDGFVNEFMGATDKEYRMMKRTVLSDELARAIVEDYQRSQLALDRGGMPGLFWVPGAYSVDKILKPGASAKINGGRVEDGEIIEDYFETAIEEAKKKHQIWAKNLVSMADDEWAVEKRRRRISASMIHAAQYFGLDREWMDPTKFASTAIKCPACATKLSPEVVLCSNCRFILDKPRWEKMEFA